MLDRQTAGCVVEKIVLPQIVSIKQASEIMKLPPYYLRRVCRENPDIAFQSGVKWYMDNRKMAEEIVRLASWRPTTTIKRSNLNNGIGKTYDTQTQRPLLCSDR